MIQRIWLATLKNTQVVVTSLTIYFVLRIRTAHAVYFGAGTLVAAFSAKVLKKCIRQPRPEGSLKRTKTYGMPSTHSCSIAFFGTYLSLTSLLLPLHPRFTSLIPFYPNQSSSSMTNVPLLSLPLSHRPEEILLRMTLAGFFLFGSSSVCWSRVRLGHHTKRQVIAGASLGSVIAFAWFSTWVGTNAWLQLLPRHNSLRALFALGPEWLREGLRETGQGWERIAEDLLWILLETFRNQDWRQGLQEIRDVAFILLERNGSDL
ncbi:uncharacterized protein JCM15063_006011 [Sporobolomyces koalae]|uniref:uncharacterized protein n=1 Tax=Sporobolomyces koalae TaxID=500713 RepID=UPI00317CCA83